MHDPELSRLVSSLLTRDPQLPRPNPTVAFWQEPPHPTVSAVQSAVLPETTDIAIIGSGITACSVAKSLLENQSIPDLRLTVFEARTLTSGATGRNGGHLVSEAVLRFTELVASVGREKAIDIARFSLANVARMKEVVESLGEEIREKSQIRDVVSVMGVADAGILEAMKESVEAFEEALPEYKGRYSILGREDAMQKYNFRDVVGAVEQRGAGALWPYRLITEIFAHLLKKHSGRFSIETSTPVTAISYDAETQYPYVLTTPRGIVRAAKVIHCTNGFATHLLPGLSGKIFPLRGTMSTQAAGPSFPNLGATTSWSYCSKGLFDPRTGVLTPGLYYVTQDPRTGDMFVGGDKQKVDELLVSDDTAVSSVSSESLASVLSKIFQTGWDDDDDGGGGGGNTSPVVRRMWSGVMGFTGDGMPVVGRLDDSMTKRGGDGEWIAAGFNGYGMDKCWLTGEAVAGMVVGRDVSSWFPSAYLVDEER
ncbi:hypothetical protein VTN96DRAFT_1939 [Rasamsonia emersonii]